MTSLPSLSDLGILDGLDTHVHAWSSQRFPAVLAGAEAVRPDLFQDHTPERVAATVQESGCAQLILVQACDPADDSLAEARLFLAAARTTPAIAGAVVGVDLRDPNGTAALLDALGTNPTLRGGRMIEPQAGGVGILSSPAARACIRELGERRLCFDLLVRSANPGQLEEGCALVEWVANNTSTTVIGDHLLKPTEVAAGRPTAEWTAALKTLAQFPCFFLKLSGMPGEVPVGTPVEQFFPFYDTALTVFGAERLMFGSDHPVSYAHKAAVDGVIAWLAARGLTGKPEAQQLFSGTGRRAYGVEQR